MNPRPSDPPAPGLRGRASRGALPVARWAAPAIVLPVPALLACHDLAKTAHGRPLFRGLSLSVESGERVGLVGPNGAGKSTLLRILAGDEVPDAGTVALASGARLAWVPQEDVLPAGATARGVILEALAGTTLEPHQREARVGVTLGKAGFGEPGAPGPEDRVETLSGGWRKRLALCRGLALEPDVLLLDEPTNHLDLDGILWLEKLLARPPFALVLITHDRYLLDEVATVMIELDPRLPAGYLRCEGVYSDLVERREALVEAQRGEQQALQQKLAKEVAFLKKTPREQRKKSAAKFTQAEEMTARLSELARRNAHGEAVQLGFAASGRKANVLLGVSGVGARGGGKQLFQGLSFSLGPGDRLGLLGPNGCGKSTLLRVLAGRAEPEEGSVRRAQHLRVAWFDQERSQLDPHATLRQSLAENGESVVWNGKPMHVTAWAARFLFPPEQLAMQVWRLSGGEKARVLLARLMLAPADVLLLDEPTNDLDIPSLEVLEESLLEFPGAVVLVSHDRFLLDRVATAVLGLGLGDGGRLLASCEQYTRARLALRKETAAAEKTASPPPPPPGPPPPPPPPPPRGGGRGGLGGARRGAPGPGRRELEGMEAAIGAAEARVAALEAELATAGLTPQRLQAAATELAAAQAEIERLFARWEELEQKRTAAAERS